MEMKLKLRGTHMKLRLKMFIHIVTMTAVSVLLFACNGKSYMEEAILEVDRLMSDLGFENEDIFTLIRRYESVTITWESTDLDVINSNGVVNSVGLNTNVEVMIFVTFKEDDLIEERSYFVIVYKIETTIIDPDPVTNPDQDKINLVKNSLVLAPTTRTNLDLITLSNGVELTWSSNSAAITSSGVVTRNEDSDVVVTLIVIFKSGEVTDSKVFTVTVEREDVLTEAKNALVITGVTSTNLELPLKTGKDDLVSVSWFSNLPEVLSNSGFITRSLTEDITVTLTATFTYKTQPAQVKTYNVIVSKDSLLDDVIGGIDISTDVYRNLSLPTNIEGVIISWQSDNAAITSSGVVTRGSSDTPVTLTATLSYASTQRTLTFDLIVKQKAASSMPAPVGFVNQGTFIAYALYTHPAYSGEMMATFSAPGQNTRIFIGPSTDGRVNISDAFKQSLTAGVAYTVVFNALANITNTEFGDSLTSEPVTFTVPISLMDPMGPLTETNDGYITWNPVLTAETYDIFVTVNNVRTLRQTLLSTDTLRFLLPDAVGVYRIEVIAKARGFTTSTRTLEYSIASENAVPLNAPVITINETTKVISWNAIAGASGYKVVVGDAQKTTTSLSYDLSLITPQQGNYSVFVIALGDVINSKDSVASNTLAYIMDKALEQVDASGLMFEIVNGHYSIKKSDLFKPEGWKLHEYIFEIYSNGTLIRTRNYNTSSLVVHFQTPADPNGLLAGLTPGSYTVHVIMVGNGTTHINSAPFIRTFTYAG
jgi:hypothetical protein